jgi:hypothetical protein
MRILQACLVCLALVGTIGCKSKYIEADVKNDSGAPISLVEVDYPSASFGTESLAAGATYHYRLKILGVGPTKVLWTDPTHHDHTVTGPTLDEGQQGTLLVTISANNAAWETHLLP